MSTGGIFKLITNDGIQDKLLMSTDHLNSRIKLLVQRNRKNDTQHSGMNIFQSNSWIPEINSISKTHMIFIDGSYKPFVASGFEYNKISASGQVQFGSRVSFTMPVFGDFINDCVIHIKLSELSVKNNKDKVRYVSLLGHKILKRIEFKVNSSVLDSITSDDYNAYYQFHVPTHKKIGWLRNMGQEIPEVATLTGDPAFDSFKEYRMIGDGNQTFKQKHDPIELWIPLLFWFKNVNNSLPSFAIPYGQTDINIDVAQISELIGYADYGGGGKFNHTVISSIELYMNNIFLQPEIVKIFQSKFGFSLIRVHTRHTEIVKSSSRNVLLSQLKWPTESIYVAFRPSSNETLSQQWHKSSQLTLNTVKMPIVAKNINLITVASGNVSTGNTISLGYVSGIAFNTNANYYVDYDIVITGGTGYLPNDVMKNRYNIISNTGGPTGGIFSISESWNDSFPNSSTTFELFKRELAINLAQYYKESPSITSLEIIAYGITIFQKAPESFYNSYLPYRFGDRMNTPSDRGWYLINFNYLPGEHQPSGHINLSRAREFYINYTSKTISHENPAELIVLCDAINFLVVKSGTAVLRYST
jgi:hypothetical protein